MVGFIYLYTFSLDHLTRLSNSTSSIFYKTDFISVLDIAMLISQGHLKYNMFRMYLFIFSSKSLPHSVLPIYVMYMSIHIVSFRNLGIILECDDLSTFNIHFQFKSRNFDSGPKTPLEAASFYIPLAPP